INGNPDLTNIHILNNVFEMPDTDPDFAFGEYVFRTGGQNDCSGLQINNNTFNANGTNGGIAIYLNPASSITNVQVNGNTFSGKVLQGVTVDGMNNVTVDGNTLNTSSLTGTGDNPQLIRITNWSSNAMTGISVTNNLLGTGGANQGGKYSIVLRKPGAGSVNGVTVDGNTVKNTTIAGIRQLENVMGVAYSGNTIESNPIGIKVDSGTVTSITDNSFGNTNFNLVNSTVATLDASPNWWGSDDPATISPTISGDVDWAPFWTDAGMTTLSTLTTVYVDAAYTSESAGGHVFGYDAFTTIQEGVDAVDEGGTVNVNSGTYNEEVHVNKNNVTLQGLGSGETRPLVNNTGEYVGSGNGIVIDFDYTDVTVDNFRITAVNTTVLGVGNNHNCKLS
ncbi:MAG: hypothetical protein ACRDGA_06865, partial [Bacteroidota bacterium]